VIFRVVTVGGPCGGYVDRCLDSILGQTDTGWTAGVVLDDFDEAPRKALGRASDKVVVEAPPGSRRGALANIKRSIELQRPEPDDVLVTVDGDDWLYGPEVLSKVREAYVSQPSLLLTYGSWVGYPDPHCVNNSAPYQSWEFQEGRLRRGPWRGTHLRTFKYGLWRLVQDADLKGRDGQYYDCAWDVAMMFPMLEMAGHARTRWMKDPLYVYNRETPHNDEKLRSARQTAFYHEIRSKPSYQPIAAI